MNAAPANKKVRIQDVRSELTSSARSDDEPLNDSTQPASEPRVFYRDTKPCDVPASLDHLRGPSVGVMTLPINVYWGPWSMVDLGIQSDVVKAYQATIREGRLVDQVALLNHDFLVKIWPQVLLPARVRKLWESRFPELTGRS
jgi:hypothetical protein